MPTETRRAVRPGQHSAPVEPDALGGVHGAAQLDHEALTWRKSKGLHDRSVTGLLRLRTIPRAKP